MGSKKISKRDLPNTNFNVENVMYSLLKAIGNSKSGTYKDCGFNDEKLFHDVLDAFEKTGLITKLKNDEYDLSNYKYIPNDSIDLSKKSKVSNWLKENVVPLLGVVISAIEIFFK